MCATCGRHSDSLFYACVYVYRQFETVIPVEDSVITEMTSALRDWGAMWKQLYVVKFLTHTHAVCVDLNITTAEVTLPFSVYKEGEFI